MWTQIQARNFPNAVLMYIFLPLLLCTAAARASGSAGLAEDSGSRPNYTNVVDRIVESIFRGYNKHQRPVAALGHTDGQPAPDVSGSSKPVQPSTEVDVNMKILSINKVDVINMEFTLDMYLRQFWKDERLRWDTHRDFRFYNESIAIPAKKEHLWLPDLFFRNGKEGYLHTMTQPNYLIRVEPDGKILYSQKVTMKFSCQMQLQTFPMDTQTCFVNIGSYGYTTKNLLFRWKRDGSKEAVELDHSMQISEFNTPDFVIVEDCTQGSATSTGSYACLKAIFTLERQLSSYLAGTYIPAILIIAVSWLSFWVNIEAVPARVTLGLLTLLGILTQASTVMANLPRVAYIKAIDIWIIASIMFVIGALIEFAVASFRARRTKMESWQQEIRNVVRSELQRLAVIRGPPPGLPLHGHGYPGFPEELEDLLTGSVEEGGGVKGNAGAGAASPVPAPDSDIDAYSRFLFPACFLLYNCFYWLYYLVLVVKIDPSAQAEAS